MHTYKGLTLRKFQDADKALFQTWLYRDHVARWYLHPQDWLDEVDNRDGRYSFIHHFIALYDGAPIGFCQYYEYRLGGETWHGDMDTEGAYSIDYLIGDPGALGKGLSKRLIAALVETIQHHEDAKIILVQPDPENKASRGALLSAGFAFDAARQLYKLTLPAPDKQTHQHFQENKQMEKYEELHALVAAQQPNICQIVALKDGQSLYSDCWNGFQPGDALHVMSVTKSVVSLLIGIAIDRGLMEGVHQQVLDFFPAYPVKRGEKTIQSVTVEHLLTMTAPYKYRSEPWTKICTSENWTTATLDILGGKAGLTDTFRYSTLGIHILTGILAQVSGMTTVDFANEYLFTPIGVAPHQNYEALTEAEHRAFILSKQPKENIWFADPQGVGTAGYGLCLSARDMAKLGQLCLDKGVCNGRQIVSSQWIAESTRPRRQCDESFGHMGYGYLWWTPDMGKPAYAALGNSGNVIYVNPAQNTVVAVAATFKPNILDRVQFIQETIEPLLNARG